MGFSATHAAGGGGVESIQEFSINFVAGDGLTKDTTITAIVTGNTEIILQNQDNSGSIPEDAGIRASITSTTNLRLTRQSSGSVDNILVNIVLKEYTAAALEQDIQRGTISLAASGTTATDTITAVGSNAYASWLGSSASSASTVHEELASRIDLTNSTTVTATRDAPGSIASIVEYQVVDPV